MIRKLCNLNIFCVEKHNCLKENDDKINQNVFDLKYYFFQQLLDTA